ncbi:hypothetical protein AX15_006549 [Amanita polypyramis BW_CC]|nr:hypothetical protein AX15_006549 [Amanita polypyramis BW_CC]
MSIGVPLDFNSSLSHETNFKNLSIMGAKELWRILNEAAEEQTLSKISLDKGSDAITQAWY